MGNQRPTKVLIVGGGFGGVRVALDLAKKKLPNTKIILVSDKPHFEYHASLYRIVAGKSPLEVCIPLDEIFKGKKVEIIEDTIISVDLSRKLLRGESESHYTFDYLVLALGSETSYFDLPGLRELAFGFKSITEALRLKRHIHEMFSSCVIASDRERQCSLHFVIVGGGATGVELASELALYTKTLARKHRLDPHLITLNLIQGGERLLPSMPLSISALVEKRLTKLGVNVLVNKRVLKGELEMVYLKDMEMKTKTVIWTTGIVPNHLYSEIADLSFDEKGRVLVDESFQAKGLSDVFIIGDAAAYDFTGTAQGALNQGKYVAAVIYNKLVGTKTPAYVSKKPFYAIPLGTNFAVCLKNRILLTGRFGWMMRRFLDLKFFLSILPFSKALLAFQSDKVLWEQCPICSEASR